MKNTMTLLLVLMFGTCFSLSARSIELNASYDYFRGLPDGSWNGNSGAFISANLTESFNRCRAVQLGASYGVYNWDGRENLVFNNPKSLQQITFITLGGSSKIKWLNAGLVYDHMFTDHFGIYDVDPNLNQLRFQAGIPFCCEEVGAWGTVRLRTAHETALGVPLKFRSVDQFNVFWTHRFNNDAKSTVWLGVPYSNSLRFSHKRAGSFIAGFFLRAPLTQCLSVEGNAFYMRARHASGSEQSKNYAANMTLGISYFFSNCCARSNESYLPLANHSNFIVDTTINQ